MPSLQKFIDKYGEIDGQKRFNEMKIRIGLASKGRNTLEWYIKKYGEIEGNLKFKEFQNKSKHTKEKYIQKYGEIKGNELWNNYVLNKKITSKRSKEYWLNKGLSDEEARLEIKKHQNNTSFEKLIDRYGYNKAFKKFKLRTDRWKKTYYDVEKDEWERRQKAKDSASFSWALKKAEGNEKLAELIYTDNLIRKQFRKNKNVSKESLKVFIKIYKFLRKTGFKRNDIFWGIANNKEWFLFDDKHKEIKFYDFTIPKLKVIIEYNGIKFHPNKNKLTVDEWNKWYLPYSKIRADEKYEMDQNKKQLAASKGFDVYEIWSDDVNIENVIDWLKEKINGTNR